MSTASTRVAHFTITGEAMTEMARDLLLSDEPGKAYRLIADGLIGPHASEAAIKVLQGTHDLIGTSSVGIGLSEAADTPELARYLKSMQFIYAGRIRDSKTWRRPVAKVVRYGPKDAKWAANRAAKGMGTETMLRWAKERAQYYCFGNETPELLKIGDENVYVIWEPCNELPHWMKPPSSFQEALDQALAAGVRLLERPSEAERELEDIELREERRQKRAEKRLAKKREEFLEKQTREWEEKLRKIGEDVRAQAGDDTFVLTLKDGREINVPRIPFIRWALCRTDLEVPEWNNVAESGLKLAMDNPDHTDWVLGSGLTLEEAYHDNVNGPAWDRAFEFQEEARAAAVPFSGIVAAMEMLHDTIHKAATVVDAGERTGIVGVDIAVFPDSEAERVDQLGHSIGVIVEKGGKLAHFAIVTQGRGITVMRHAKACTLFKSGMRVNLNPKTGRIVILDEDEG